MATIVALRTKRVIAELPSVLVDCYPALWTLPMWHELTGKLYVLAYDESEANVMVERIMADIELERVC